MVFRAGSEITVGTLILLVPNVIVSVDNNTLNCYRVLHRKNCLLSIDSSASSNATAERERERESKGGNRVEGCIAKYQCNRYANAMQQFIVEGYIVCSRSFRE